MPSLVTRVVAHQHPQPWAQSQAHWGPHRHHGKLAVHQSLVLPGSSWGQGALGKCIAFS